ncbi:type II secretion system F family protein [bacterium]|nr:type II secretion system F family protein [bacterium]
MSQYSFRAINNAGQVVVDVIDAPNIGFVTEYLDKLNYLPLQITEKKAGMFAAKTKRKKVDPKEVIVFTKQFATLFKAGVPLVSCLAALEEQAGSEAMKEILGQVSNDIQSGKPLCDALRPHSGAFSDLYVDMIRVGEAGGVLEEVLERLVTFLTHDLEIRTNIKKATRYPIIVLCGISVAFVVLILAVVPKFVSIFQKMKVELPLPTRILIGINTAITEYWIIVIPALVAIYFGVRAFVKTPAGRRFWDERKLHLPVFGMLNVKTYISRFAKTFETLNRSGLPILQTLTIIAQTMGNIIVADEIYKAINGVKDGQGLAQPLKKSVIFPPIVVQMISIGEKSGALDSMMQNIAEYYDSEIDYTVKNLTTLIEPMITVLLGGLVLFIALSIFLPMWDMMGHMGKK